MRMTLLVHIAAGGLAIVVGYLALFAAKGARLHRRSGMLCVYAMLTMAVSAMLYMVLRREGPTVNFLAALLTSYLVVTGLATVRPPSAGTRWLDRGALLVALAVGLTSLTFGLEAIANGGRKDGVPAFPYFMFGIAGLLGSVGDLRMIHSGGLRGAPRLARHLWRMCFALWIASASFFLGQADEIPEPLRIVPLLAILAFLPLLVMLYWLWRVRIRRSFRGIVGVSAPEAVVKETPHQVAGVG